MSEKPEISELPTSIKTEEKYKYFLNELNAYYTEGKLPLKLNESEIIRFKAIVDLLEAFDSTTTLFEIQYTNNTADIRNFSNYDEAFRCSYNDHLWDVISIKKLLSKL